MKFPKKDADTMKEMTMTATAIISSYVVQKRGIPREGVVPALRKMLRGGMGAVLCSSIRTSVATLGLHTYTPQPFHSVASDKSLSFEQYMSFLEVLAGRDFKAWMFYRREGQLVHEVSVSNRGLTLDGRLTACDNLRGALAFAAQYAPDNLKAQTFRVGKNCGALAVGQPGTYPFGITGHPEVSSRFFWPGRGKNYQFKGVFPVSEFESIITGLIDSQILTEFEIFQPALSAAVKKVTFWKDLNDSTFAFELGVFPCSRDILEALSPGIA